METRRNKFEVANKLGAPDTNSKVLDELRAVREALEASSRKSLAEPQVVDVDLLIED